MKKYNANTSNEPHLVIFEVLSFKGKLKKGSSIEIGERFVGEFFPKKKKVYFSDVNNQDWTFDVGANCEIIDKI